VPDDCSIKDNGPGTLVKGYCLGTEQGIGVMAAWGFVHHGCGLITRRTFKSLKEGSDFFVRFTTYYGMSTEYLQCSI
jgi:hypothetical protein